MAHYDAAPYGAAGFDACPSRQLKADVETKMLRLSSWAPSMSRVLETEADCSGSAGRGEGTPVRRGIRNKKWTPAREHTKPAARAESRTETRYAASARLATYEEVTRPQDQDSNTISIQHSRSFRFVKGVPGDFRRISVFFHGLLYGDGSGVSGMLAKGCVFGTGSWSGRIVGWPGESGGFSPSFCRYPVDK